MYHHDVGKADNASDWRDVAEEIEIELVVERRVDRFRGTDREERIAVGWRTHDRLGSEIAAGAGAVLNEEGLPQPLRQPLTQQALHDVRRAARGKAHEHAHWLGRIGL